VRARAASAAPKSHRTPLRIIVRSTELDAEPHAFARGLLRRALEQAGPEVRLELDIARRAAEWTDGGARAEPPPDDLRAKLVDARAKLVIGDARIERLERKLARAKRKLRAHQGVNETGA
jgi:hypothetical protein